MKTIIRLEEAAMFMICSFALTLENRMFTWWAYLLLFIGPDISMFGYLFGNKAGAVVYNIFHHKGIALIILMTGIAFIFFPLILWDYFIWTLIS